MALYRTDPYHTIPYKMHVYRTVRYLTVLKLKPIRHLREDHGETAIYRAVRYNTVRHRERYVGARCTVRDKLRGQIYFAAALGHKHKHIFGIKLSCKFATRLCQLLANLLCYQDLFNVCDNRYGDMGPCFIAGSLVVKSYVSDLCAYCACQPCIQCLRGAFYFKASPFFLYFCFKFRLLGFYY